MSIYQQIVAVCWAAMLVAWVVFRGPAAERHSPRARFLSVLRLALAVALLIGLYWIGRGRAFASVRSTETLELAGAVICVAGLAFATWARVAMSRPLDTSIARRDQPPFVVTGPFAYVRHPSYSGVSAMLVGSALVNPAAYVEVLLAIVSLVVLARREEREMLRLLPEVYPAYVRRTKGFVPFLFYAAVRESARRLHARDDSHVVADRADLVEREAPRVSERGERRHGEHAARSVAEHARRHIYNELVDQAVL